MFGYLLSAVVALFLISYFLIWPIAEYFRDPKGLRKYPSLNFLCGITDLAFLNKRTRVSDDMLYLKHIKGHQLFALDSIRSLTRIFLP